MIPDTLQDGEASLLTNTMIDIEVQKPNISNDELKATEGSKDMTEASTLMSKSLLSQASYEFLICDKKKKSGPTRTRTCKRRWATLCMSGSIRVIFLHATVNVINRTAGDDKYTGFLPLRKLRVRLGTCKTGLSPPVTLCY